MTDGNQRGQQHGEQNMLVCYWHFIFLQYLQSSGFGFPKKKSRDFLRWTKTTTHPGTLTLTSVLMFSLLYSFL